MRTEKWLRGVFYGVGVGWNLATALINRCNSLWGEGWQIGAAGIVFGDKVVVPAADYVAFANGLPYGADNSKIPLVKVSVPQPDEEKKEEELVKTSSLVCVVCGKRMPTEAALKGHMRKHEERGDV
jgi:hypothetical protein